MRKAILAALMCLAMLITAIPAASEPIQFGHTWGTEFYDYASAVDVDSSGNLYLSGTIIGAGNHSYDATFVAKVNIYGLKTWDILLSSPTRGLTLVDTALGPSNSLYVVGSYFEVSTYDSGTYYAKIASSGSIIYQKYLPNLDVPNRICANTGGNGFIIVGDTTYYGTGAIVAIKDDGSVNWALSVTSPDGESPWAAVTDSSGAVYTFIDSSSDANVAIAKFSKTGRLIRQSVLLTDYPNDEYTWDLALGRDGNIYALGANYGMGQLLIASFTPKLDLRWDEYVGTPTNGYEAPRLAVASDGTLYAIGYTTYTTTGDPGPAIFHFSTTGAILDATVYASSPSHGSFGMNDACTYPSGGIVVAGWSDGYPKSTPVNIDWITVTEIPNSAWTADNTVWSKLSLKTIPGDLTSASNVGVMDNYAADQSSQAWYGIISPPPPAFKSSISVKTTQDQSVLSFRGSASGGRSPYTYQWYFDDGSKASGQTVDHQYAIGGTFNVLLVVIDAKGQVSWATTVVSIPVYPVIVALYHSPEPAYIGSTVSFNVTAYNPDGGSLTYSWDFGDGASASTFDPYAYHAYSVQGTYVCTVIVTNVEGLSTSASQSVTVKQYTNTPPIASFYFSPTNPYVGNQVRFDGSMSYDPDGWITSYSWNFGDMYSASGMVAYHAYSAPGRYMVGLTVYDNMGAVGYRQMNITVLQSVPSPPIASFSARVEGTTVWVDASSSTGAAGILNYTWFWGDGSPAEVHMSPYASHTYPSANLSGDAAPPVTLEEPIGVEGPPQVPYTIVGYVATADGTPIVGCNVLIENLRTGDVGNTTTESTGIYLYDLSAMFNGYQNGDMIHVIASNGVVYGENNGVVYTPPPYLFLNVTVSPIGPVSHYTITLIVMDTLGRTDSAAMEVWIGGATGGREVSYEISHFFESYLKNSDLTIQGNRTATPGLNSWWTARMMGYGDQIVRDTYPFVTAYSLESGYTTPDVDPGFGLQTMARMHITAKNLTTVGTSVAMDPIFIPILNPNVGGGVVTLQWRSDVMTAAEVAAMKAINSTYFGRTYYGAPRIYLADDGYWNQIYGHMTFDRLAARTYLGLPGAGDLRTEFTVANTGNAIGLVWMNDWMTETGPGGIYNIEAAYEYSNDIRQVVLTLDPSSTADHLNVRIWSMSWGNDMMLMRYLDVSGVNSYMQSYFEDMYLNATIGPTSGDIETSYYMQYAMLGWANPATGEASWMLEAVHADYVATNDPPPAWQSRFNPYDPETTNWMRTSRLPGTVHYGQQVSYWTAPMYWNLKPGEKLTVKLPTATAVGFGPYVGTTDVLSSTKVAELNSHAYTGQLVLGSCIPGMNTYFDQATKTITLTGPTYFQRNPNPANPLINYTGVPQFVFDVDKPGPIPPYPLVGITFDNNGVRLGRVNVSVTNMRTGQLDDTIVSDMMPGMVGFYTIDLNTLGQAQPGDVIRINASTGTLWGTNETTVPLEFMGYMWLNVTLAQQGNAAPYAMFSYNPLTPYVGNQVTFDASPSYDLDGWIVSYSWNFGDMTTGSGQVAYHTYTSPGTYYVTLRVYDNLGAPCFRQRNVTVTQPVPIASFSAEVIGSTVYVNATSSTAATGIISYAWNWGDGSPIQVFTGPWASHTYSAGGAFTVTLTVTDALGQTAWTSRVIWVGGQTGARQVTYEVSHFFESYLKNPDLTVQGNRTATPGLNSWWSARMAAYGEVIVHNTYPFVTAYSLESSYTIPDVDPGFGLQTMARMHITARNLTTIGTNIGMDPIFIPILNPNIGGGVVTLQWRSDIMTAAEIAAMRALNSTYFGRTYYAAPRISLQDDGTWNQLYGHMVFDRLAAQTYLGLSGSGDLRTEFTTANTGNAIGTAWLMDWLTETGAGGIYDISAAYEYSNDIRQVVLTLDPSSTANNLNVRIWSLSWGNDMMLMRYMDVTGVNSYMQSYFEDMYLNATIGPMSGNVETSYYMQYAIVGWADPLTGEASWMLEAMHLDYVGTNDPPPTWQSRFNPYDPDQTNWMRTSRLPGTIHYGQQVSYWTAPMYWNLVSGEKLIVKMPTAQTLGYGPYVGTSDALNAAKVTELNSHSYWGELVLGNGSPDLNPYYNQATKTITIVGPTGFPRNPNPANPLINYTGVPQFVFDVHKSTYDGVATNPTPADGATGIALTSTLSWTAPPGANRFMIEIFTPSNGWNRTFFTATPSITFTLDPGIEWSWHVASSRDDGATWGPPSATWTFTTTTLTA